MNISANAECESEPATLARARFPWRQQKLCIPPAHVAIGLIALLVVLAATLPLPRYAWAQTPDQEPPTLVSATVTASNAIVLAFNEPLDSTSIPAASAFTVKVGGVANTVDAAAYDSTSQGVQLTVSTAILARDTVTVSYSKPEANALKDGIGNETLSFTDHAAVNNLRDTLVSNVGQTVSSVSGDLATHDIGQGFVTGSAASYDLTEVEVLFSTVPSSSATVTAVIADGLGASNNIVATLTNPSDWSARSKFAIPSGTTLSKNTTYYLIIEGTDGQLQVTHNDAEDSDAAANWTIDDTTVIRAMVSQSGLGGTWANSVAGASVQMAIKGIHHGRPGTPELAVTAKDQTLVLEVTIPDHGSSDLTGIEYSYKETTSGTYTNWTPVTETISNSGGTFEIGGLANGTDYTVQVQTVNDIGTSDPSNEDSGTPNTPPAITSVAITSDPGADKTYAVDDEIEFTVTFDKDLTHAGTNTSSTPATLQWLLDYATDRAGEDQPEANCAIGTNTKTLVCTDTVQEGWYDTDGIAIEANAITEFQPTSFVVGPLGQPANRTHSALAADSDHKVDGVKPRLLDADVSSDDTGIILTFSEDVGMIDRSKITITLTTALTASDTSVTVEFDADAVADMAGNGIASVRSADLKLLFDICERTPAVEAALLAAVAATDCALVPATQLAAITSLDRSSQSISSLQSDDFVGLTGLTSLDLSDNALTTLPAGVFTPLTSLTSLDLGGNTGLTYSPYLLSVLTSLVTLNGETYSRPSAPGAPTSLTGAFVAGNIELSWTAPATGVPTGYQVLRKAGSDGEEVYVEDTYDADADPPSTTYLDTGVTEGVTYVYRVRALNAGGAGIESDSVTVLAMLVISGPSAVSHPEASALRVAAFTAGPPRSSLVWSLTGDDNGDFSIDGGVLRFAGSPPMADYESPADSDEDNEYSITVQAGETGATSVTMNVTVTVTDVDEVGTLTLSSTRPKLGTALTATLADPDDIVDGTPVYKWERSLSPNSWAVISGATSSAYTPVAADTGRFLRATVTYEDGHGTGKTANTVAYEVVTASHLTGLQVTTTDATVTPDRALMPAFSADVLHYAIGCADSDTMTVTPSAATGVRLAVNGVQVASGGSRSVTVGGESDVHITLTGADGAITTYVVHCLIGGLWGYEATKTPGATGVLEDLILLLLDAPTVAMLDNNAVPRFHRNVGFDSWAHFRVERVTGADQQQGHDLEYRYWYVKNVSHAAEFTVLGQDLQILDSGIDTVAPLETTDQHDFRILPDGNYLLLAYEPAQRDLSDLTFDHPDIEATQPQQVRDAAIQIITPDGEEVFTWNSWGIMPLEDCTQEYFAAQDDRGLLRSYAHINSLQMIDGLIIASFRGCSKVLAIDPNHAEDHKVAWRVGHSNLTAAEWEARGVGPAPLAIVGDPAGQFCGQHAAQVLPNGNLILYDNGTACLLDPLTGEEAGRASAEYSRAVEYTLDHDNGEAVFVRDHSLRGIQQYVGYFHGQVEPLADGDWLVSWGRPHPREATDESLPVDAVTQVDPDTGVEKFSLRDPDNKRRHSRAIPLHPVALFRDPGPLAAALPPSSATSVFHSGSTDTPQVVVAFSRPVVDFAADTPSLSVTGATVASVSVHVVAGEPANTYLLTLTPDGDGAITFSLVANEACADGGICAADGTLLTSVPTDLVIGGPVTVEFGQASYTVVEDGTVDVTVSLSAAHQGVRAVTVPLTVADSATMTHTYLVSAEEVSFAAGERTKTVTVSIQQDQDDNDDEYVTIGFGALPGGVSAGTTSETQVNITDDDDTPMMNICDRTPAVETALLAAVTATDCAFVPDSQLAAVTSLDLSSQSISALQADDFAGLTGLTSLDLADNALTTLPAGVFTPLTSLTSLDLRGNTGLSYSPYLLSVLTGLVTLNGETYSRPSAPGAPTSLTATFVGGSIELSWAAPATGVPTGYQVLRKAGSGDEEVYVEDTYPSTNYIDTGVTEGETYEYRVRALNAGGAGIESDSVTVLAMLVISGPSAVSHPEASAFRVAAFTAGPPRSSLVWSLTGDDSGDFTIEGGVLRFAGTPPMADHESPADSDEDNEYSITVQAGETGATSVTMNVTVTVTDVDEAGTLTLSSTRPKLGTALTATLADPDGVVDGTPVYKWERSLSPNSWAVISGATSSAYTPVAADTGRFLRATATYEDGHGTGKTANTVAYEVVTASLLTGLQVTTDDSTADSTRALAPAFSADVLHYRIGCDNSDTMEVTPSAATGVRLAVNGVQVASGGSRSVTVGGESDVHITLTTANGAVTTYVLHCLRAASWILEAHKTPGTAGILEELILLTLPFHTLLMLDNNGVPRFHRELSHNTWAYFRVERAVGADQQQGHEPEYRYSYAQAREQGNHRFSVLDQDLERIDRDVQTVDPLATTDLHDFRVLENGNYLLMAYEPADRDLSNLSFTHPDVEESQPQRILDSAIQIITPDGREVFTWNSWGNIPLEDCTQHRFVKFRGGPGGYAHINSLQMVDGLIIASFRGCSQVIAIDPDHTESHKVVWRVGRTNLSAEEWEARDIGPMPLTPVGDPAGEFCAQHAAQVLPNGNLMLFDNGVHCLVNPWTGELVSRTDEDYYSRGVEYALDHANGEAVFVRGHSLHDAQQYLGNTHGQIEPLANGDWLISWGRARSDAPDEEIPDEAITQVDPDTGLEKFSFRVPNPAAMHYRAIPLHPVALFRDPGPLAAALPPSSATSVFNLGSTDAPQVVVAFSRPVVDFDADTPSLSVTGATVASVSPHVAAGEAANAYLVTLTPDGEDAITFSLVASQACADGGICTVDGTVLTSVPAALVIGEPITAQFAQASYTVVEGGTVDVTVSLSAAHQGVRAVTVPLTVTDSATMTHSYLVSAESVSFAAGERSKAITVSIRQDQDDNDDEHVTLGFGVLSDGVTAGTRSETQIDITDDDYPIVTVQFGAGSYAVDEGDSVEVELTLSAAPERAVVIGLEAAREGGASSGDFSAPLTVMFNGDETSKSITFSATDDAVDDDHESVVIRLATPLPIRVSTGSPDATTVAITDNDDPQVSVTFDQNTYTISEGSHDDIRVTLSANPERRVEIPITITDLGGATGGDYLDLPTSITFHSGQTEQTITFEAHDDGVDDDDESVRLEFGDLPDRVSGGAITQTTVEITDDDLPQVKVRFDDNNQNYRVTEGGSVTVTLKLDIAPERVVTIPLETIAVGGASDEDYTLSADSVTFLANQTTRTVTLTAVDDRVDDNDEGVRLDIAQSLPAGVSLDTGFTTTIDIVDNDVTVSFGQDAYVVNEGEGVTVEVRLNEAPLGVVRIPIEQDRQDGAGGADYSGVPASLTFSTTDTVQSFTITATDDTVDDDEESLRLTFGPLPSTVVTAAPAQTTVAIVDDDDPEVAVHFEQAEYTVSEGDGVSVKVRLSKDPERTVTIPVTVTEQGDASSLDYGAVPSSVRFLAGETERVFLLSAVADDDFDAGESVLLAIDAGALPERVRVGDIAATTVLITDDDLPQVRVGFEAPVYTAGEGSGITIVLTLSEDPQRTVTIPLSANHVDGNAGEDDYLVTPARVTFTAGETVKTFTFTAHRDSDDDDGEYVTLAFGSLPEGVSRGDTAETTVTIREVAQRASDGGGGGGGGFGPALTAPKFVDGFRTERPLAVTAKPGDAVGDPVVATHPNNDDVTYSLSGTNANLFIVDAETGQIRRGEGVTLELGQTYTVNLTATDSSGTGAIIIVVIEVVEGVGDPYDLNRNGTIEKDEVLRSISDYFAGLIEKDEVLALIARYFAA